MDIDTIMFDDNQMAVAEFLHKMSQRIAVKMHEERWKDGGPYGAWCACVGRHNGDPDCGCAMKWIYQVGSCWYRIGIDGTAEYLCPVGYYIVHTKAN